MRRARFEGVQAAKRFEKCLLRGVPRFISVAQRAVGEMVDGPIVTLDECAERFRAPGERLGHERLIVYQRRRVDGSLQHCSNHVPMYAGTASLFH
jgi:hypothetical protein